METAIQQAEIPQLPAQKIDLVKYSGYSVEARKTAEAISVVDDTEAGMAINARSKIKTLRKEVENDRKDKKSPFLEMSKRVDAFYTPILESFDQADAIIEQKLIVFQREKERIQREAAAKAEAEYQAKIKAEQERAKKEKREANIVAPPPVILPAEKTIHGGMGTTTFRKFWNYKVTDIHALYKSRPDLVELSEKRRDVLEAIKDGKKIDGLEVFEDMTTSGR